MKYLAAFLFFSAQILAQTGSVGHSSPRETAMGETYSAVSRGIYSFGNNPANLSMSKDFHFELGSFLPLPNINVRGGNNFINIEDYNYFFGGVETDSGKEGRTLTESDKSRFKEMLSDGAAVFADYSITFLSFSYTVNDKIGAFGFSMTDAASARVSMPKIATDLIFEGNKPGNYDFGDAHGKASYLRTYSLSYSRPLNEIKQNIFDKISFGFSIKYVQGMAYVGLDNSDMQFNTNNYFELNARSAVHAYSSFSPDLGVEYDFDSLNASKPKSNETFFPAPAGTGIGVDLGTTFKLNDAWQFALAVTDIGSIKWKREAAEFTSNWDISLNDLTDTLQTDNLGDSIEIKQRKIDGFTTQMATALRVGASLQLNEIVDGFPGEMLLAFDYTQGFNDEPGNSPEPRFSFGFEWKPCAWIPYIRSGVSAGGEDDFSWAIGMGMDAGAFEFNIASSDFQYIINQNRLKKASVGIGTRWRF
jgi:hypothetical protein